MKALLVILLLLNTPAAFAVECKHSVSLLEEKQPAPCTGFLFSPEAERKAVQASKDAVYFEKLADLYRQRADAAHDELYVSEERLKMYMKTSHDLAKELNRKENQSFWQKTTYFALGVLVVSLSIYGASQVQK